MRMFLCILLAFSSLRCGVELGNVGAKGRSEVGAVKILVAQQRGTGSESLNIQLGSLSLIASDGIEQAALSPSASTFDLYSAHSDGRLLLAESSMVQAGKYAKISIRLAGDKPVQYRDEGGAEFPVGLVGGTDESFTFTQDITVSAGQTTTIILNIDPRASLKRTEVEGQTNYIFEPLGEATSIEDLSLGNGTTSVENAKWACVYAYHVANNEESASPSGPLLPLVDSKGVETRPIFASKDSLVKDNDDSCTNAFTKVPVINGEYSYYYLPLLGYSFRIFTDSGDFVDDAEDIYPGLGLTRAK